MHRIPLALLLVCLVVRPALAAEAPPDPMNAKLRESLRTTMLQLQTAQGERDALQSEKVELEAKVAILTQKLEEEKKAADLNQKAAEASAEGLNKRLENQSGEIARLQVSLEKWKDSQRKAVELGKAIDEKRARAAAEVLVLNRKVADQQIKNAGMFKLGNEILDRYAKFGLGAALTAREPFVGLTRTKFENLIQDYGDKLAAEKIKP